VRKKRFGGRGRKYTVNLPVSRKNITGGSGEFGDRSERESYNQKGGTRTTIGKCSVGWSDSEMEVKAE